jgi:1-acyl-sn-glycerol-3-phosphate acyltransferase
VARRKRGLVLGTAATLLRPLMMAFTRRDWRHAERIPRDGGFVVVGNHVSYADPLVIAHLLYDSGRLPRFLGKAEVFDVPVLGRLLVAAGQIPVYRQSTDAASALRAAIEAVNKGECVVVYPEGTITRDPNLWPMTGKTGAVRIALSTRCPVIPIAQWGSQSLLGPYSKKPDLLPVKTMTLSVGEPVALDDLRDQPLSPAMLRDGTERLMDAITELLAEIRGETAPPQRFDARSPDQPRIGKPSKPRRRGRTKSPGGTG